MELWWITTMSAFRLLYNNQVLSPVSIQTQSLALRALRKRKPQETQALALANSQLWLLLLRPSIAIGWRLRLLRENFTQQTQAPANRNARLKQWQPWLAACLRKRLRLMETGLYTASQSISYTSPFSNALIRIHYTINRYSCVKLASCSCSKQRTLYQHVSALYLRPTKIQLPARGCLVGTVTLSWYRDAVRTKDSYWRLQLRGPGSVIIMATECRTGTNWFIQRLSECKTET